MQTKIEKQQEIRKFHLYHPHSHNMTVMSATITAELCENARLAREMAISGNYDSAGKNFVHWMFYVFCY